MLSIVNLIEAGTITRELAAYCMAAIGRGASFMVGALPGGAGKTTVMGALLNFVPNDVELAPADGMSAIRRGLDRPKPRTCHICHEIGSGGYYAYLWDEELRAYFQLAKAGHMLATNLHADTFEQVRAQVCDQNGVTAGDFRRMNLMIFLSVCRAAGGTTRRIERVWESDGTVAHREVYVEGNMAESGLVPAADIRVAREIVERLMGSGARTIAQVRRSMMLSIGCAQGG